MPDVFDIRAENAEIKVMVAKLSERPVVIKHIVETVIPTVIPTVEVPNI